jgi:hypothetical protein
MLPVSASHKGSVHLCIVWLQLNFNGAFCGSSALVFPQHHKVLYISYLAALFFFVFHGNKHIILCSSGVLATDEKEQKQDKKGFSIWHCQKSGTILKEICGSSYRYFYCLATQQ